MSTLLNILPTYDHYQSRNALNSINPTGPLWKTINKPIGSIIDTSTYFRCFGLYNQVFFGFDPPNIPVGSRINSISIISYQSSSAGAGGRLGFRINGENGYCAPAIYANGNGWGWLTYTFLRNPVTGGAWDLDTVNGTGPSPLQAIGLALDGTNPYPAQLGMTINYDPPGTWDTAYTTLSPSYLIAQADSEAVNVSWTGTYYASINDPPGLPDIAAYLQPSNPGRAWGFWFDYPRLPPYAKNIVVRLVHRACSYSGSDGSGNNSGNTYLSIGTTIYYTLEPVVVYKYVANHYETYYYDYTFNPGSRQAWTPEDINGLSSFPLSSFGWYPGNSLPRMTQVYGMVFFDAPKPRINYGNIHTLAPVNSTPGNGNIVMLSRPVIPQNGKIIMIPVVTGGNITMVPPGNVDFFGGKFARWDSIKGQWIKAPFGVWENNEWELKPLERWKDIKWELVDTTGKPWWSLLI